MADSNCIPEGSLPKARWGHSGDYRANAHKGIKAKSKRLSVYNDDNKLEKQLSKINPKDIEDEFGRKTPIVAGSAEHRARYKLDKFKSGGSPYGNHCHHLIPANDFVNLFEGEKKELLYSIEYDVNNKDNLIFLPSESRNTKYHLLPWHPTSHKKYSLEVKSSASEIEDVLDKAIQENDPCKTIELKKCIVSELEGYQNDLWTLLVNLGKKTSGPSINSLKIK